MSTRDRCATFLLQWLRLVGFLVAAGLGYPASLLWHEEVR
jgi:hypothetical protein